MSNNTPASPPLSGPAQLQRRARALIGWLEPADAVVILAGRRHDAPSDPQRDEIARRARDEVAARPTGLDQANIIEEIPAELEEHVATLLAAPAAQPFIAEGWRVKLVDLRRVFALQPTVFTEQAGERVAAVDPEDLRSIATVSLPLPTQVELPAQFDQARQAWIISSANPNLRILGQSMGRSPESVAVLGFGVGLTPSFLQVARAAGRYVLRDGYHRAYGFLTRGINRVPTFVRDFGPHADLGLPAGLLPRSVFLGDRPPTVADFLADTVSVDVLLPASQKMIVVHALELNPLG
jgi:hypothetical protein